MAGQCDGVNLCTRKDYLKVQFSRVGLLFETKDLVDGNLELLGKSLAKVGIIVVAGTAHVGSLAAGGNVSIQQVEALLAIAAFTGKDVTGEIKTVSNLLTGVLSTIGVFRLCIGVPRSVLRREDFSLALLTWE